MPKGWDRRHGGGRRLLSVILISASATVSGLSAAAGAGKTPPLSQEWPTHLHDPAGTRYSPLTQITPANVVRLQLAWSYHMKPANAGTDATPPPQAQGRAPSGNSARNQRRFAESEVTPLVIHGVMYIDTPYGKILALDPVTGKEIWSHDGRGPTRGLEYWPGDKATPPQIVYTQGGGLVELDAKTGLPNPHFGTNGMAMPSSSRQAGSSGSSPPVIYKNIIISGAANPYGDGRPGGDIRAFDAATGKQLWRFDTIPLKGEFGYDSWAPGSAERNTGAHVWGLMTLDAKRGILYAPINAPNWNRYGGDHVGDDLFSTSIIALDAKTGKRLWHFQIVHHDIWDMDADAPSTLFDVKKDGKVLPAIGAISKSALLFILDRVTGKPIFGVEERPVPQSEVPGEKTSPTQPFPVKPEPLGRQSMTMDDIANVTPEHRQACLDMMKANNVTVGGPYMPPGFEHPSVNFPGPNGSVNWGGGSFDPKLGYYIVNSQDLGQLTELGSRDTPLKANGVTGGNAPLDNDAIPFSMVGLNGRFKQMSSDMMCQQPPWGRLTAVNVNTGEIAWQVPLGITDSLPPGQQKTGRPNSGGGIVTASGLVFIGATDDARFRAFDARTGAELWTIKIPAGSHSVPVTYMGRDGKQYVVFPSTGGDFVEDPGADDELLAYRLP